MLLVSAVMNAPLGDGEDVRPCVHCGRPVPQRGGAGRPFRYCRDNDGACLKAARNSRLRERTAPGLSGQVARTWELVERLELTAGTLADSLHAELSPAGVQRQVAAVRAEATAEIAAAHTERDEAREEARAARAEAARLRDETATALVHAAELADAVAQARAGADAAVAARAAAQAARDEALADRDVAREQAARADGLREHAEQERERLAAELTRVRETHAAGVDALRGQVAALTHEGQTLRVRVAEAAREREQLATDLSQARERAEDLRRAADGAKWQAQAVQADLDRTRDELDRARAAVERGNAERVGLVDQVGALRAELATAAAERGAALRYADQLAAQVSALTTALAAPREPEPEDSLA